ncbi:MAG: Gfo/Idh/MocA family protein, partial [Chloroflexota bacterium]
MDGHRISMLGTGLIADFYTMTLHGQRGRDQVRVVYSRSPERGEAFKERWGIPESTTDIDAAIEHPETDVVIVALPNFLHEEAIAKVAAAGKAVLCTKPLGRTAAEARRMLQAVEDAGIFAGYLEDLVYTPKTLKAVAAVEGGAIGDVTWVRSRETHPGPHSAWFWDGRLTGGGPIIDLGCHCIEIIRNFAGKGNRPVEVMCHTDTLVHPIADEDNAIALIRFESG